MVVLLAALADVFACRKESGAGSSCPPGAVDLGLSVYWASCNVGASSPEEYGEYFAWGETEPKDDNNCIYSYRYSSSSTPLTKYGTDSTYGIVDNKTVLDPEDDVAHVKLGGSWRMPTVSEIDELKNTSNCTWEWTTMNGVNGYKVTSKKIGYTDKWIFLPAAGGMYDPRPLGAGSVGVYWSSSLDTDYPYRAFHLSFRSAYVTGFSSVRHYGLSVRPVSK